MSVYSTKKFQYCCGQKHDLSIKHFCILLGHIGFNKKTVECLEIATSLKAKTRYFSILSIYYTVFPLKVAGIRDIKRCVQISAFV